MVYLFVSLVRTCKQLAIYKSKSVRKSMTMVWGLTGTKAPNNSLPRMQAHKNSW